jgi:Xaa-Pro aminopeptidase
MALSFDYADRRAKLLKQMASADCSAILISDDANVTYLTGFSGGDSYLYLDRDGNVLLISDGRYEEQIQSECPDIEAYIRPITMSLPEATGKLLNKQRYASVGVEGHSLTQSSYQKINDCLRAKTIWPTAGLVEKLREKKDALEIERIERAIHVAEQAFLSVKASLRGKMTEKDIADDLEYAMRRLGASESSFQTIVGAGPRAALPHGIPSSKKIGEESFVLFDWGAKVNGYVSDLTRVLVADRIPAKFSKVYRVVQEAQAAAVAAIRPGVPMEEIDRIAREKIENAGFGKRFTHSLGHGFGLRVHESIRLAKGQTRPLEVGMVVTIEPGIYLPGWGGVRIEDDCLVTKDGYRVLSKLPTNLDDNRVSWM